MLSCHANSTCLLVKHHHIELYFVSLNASAPQIV